MFYMQTYNCGRLSSLSHQYIGCLQVAPVIEYAWDMSSTRNSGRELNMDLRLGNTIDAYRNLSANTAANTSTAQGHVVNTTYNAALVSSAECKSGSCIKFYGADYMLIPSYNYGSHSGLTFAVWFKPSAAADSDASIFDAGDVGKNERISIARFKVTSNLAFGISRSKSSSSEFITTSNDAWLDGTWKHIVWTLKKPPTPGSEVSVWHIYLDGVRAHTFTGLYPTNASTSTSYLAKSLLDDKGFFIGWMDHFKVFSYTKSSAMAQKLYWVRSSSQWCCVY
jgi:hypothetical protein